VDRDPVDELRERLVRHPAERDPLQHATAHFHLGGVLLGRSDLDQAEESFAAAAALFGARGARPEQAKALNGLGATLRADGRLELAARAFAHAAAGLAAAGLRLDEGAARFNLGLVLREAGDTAEAVAALSRAVELLEPDEVPAQAAAATRELGVTRFERGDLAAAETDLSAAVELADRVGDHPSRAAAANALGLVRLAAGSSQEAMQALRTAVAASPRAVRPEAFAMAKANLALACERAGAPERARLAARQAVAAPAVPEPVRLQAAGVLERLGPGGSDLRAVLEDEEPSERPLLVREELLRVVDATDDELMRDMRGWIEAHVASGLEAEDVAELWLGGLLELPPEALTRVVHGALAAGMAADEVAREEFRAAVTRAMVRFHVPQWMRLQDVFSQAALDVGDAGSWR